MAKKKTGQQKKAEKMSLQDFLQDTGSSTAWGDRADDEFIVDPGVAAPAAGSITTEDIRNEREATQQHQSNRRMGQSYDIPASSKSDLDDAWRSGSRGATTAAPSQAFDAPPRRERIQLQPVTATDAPYGMEREQPARATLERMSDKAPPTEGPFVCFMANLPFQASIDDVGNFFVDTGKCNVNDVVLKEDPQTGRAKGYGYVIFENLESLKFAVEEMHGANFLGRPIKLDYVDPEVAHRTAHPHSKPSFLDGFNRGREERAQRYRRDAAPPTEADVVDTWKRGNFVETKRGASQFQGFGGQRKERRETTQSVRRETTQPARRSEKPEKASIFGEGKAWDNVDADRKAEEKAEQERERIRKLVEERHASKSEGKKSHTEGESSSRTSSRWGGDDNGTSGRRKKYTFGKDRNREDKGNASSRGRQETSQGATPEAAPVAKVEQANAFDVLNDLDE